MTEPSGTRGVPAIARTRGPHQHRRVAAQLLPLLLRPASVTEPDLAFGAFQTGSYLTAFGIAINRMPLSNSVPCRLLEQ
jgi:hypothetical protein